MARLRHTDEWVGLIVLIAAVLFLGAILQAGVFRAWLQPVSILKIVLPQDGVGGLEVGAGIEVLGTHAGAIRRIVIEPNQQIFAEAAIDDQARAFIRRDSVGVIRRRFGVAGAAFIEISRGNGAPLDWKFAVIQATAERAPTDNLGALVDSAREKIFPIIDDIGRTTHSLAEMTGRLERGEGDIGRLLTDETLVRNAETTVASLRDNLGHLTDDLQGTVRDVRALVATANSPKSGAPALLKQVDAILASARTATGQLAQAMARTPGIAKHVEEGTQDLPALLSQTQVTAEALEKLLVQLRGSWLLGGSGSAAPEPVRLPPTEARP
jgi:phospholipid/cholesterol/gamma-HCH transport system substrate-binding protein